MNFSKKNEDNKSLEEFVRDFENKVNKTFRNESPRLKECISTKYDEALYNEFTYNSRFFDSWVNCSAYARFIKKVPPGELRLQAKEILVLILMVSHLFDEPDRSKISKVLFEILNDLDASQNYANIPEILLSYFYYIQDHSGLEISKNFILECFTQISIALKYNHY